MRVEEKVVERIKDDVALEQVHLRAGAGSWTAAPALSSPPAPLLAWLDGTAMKGVQIRCVKRMMFERSATRPPKRAYASRCSAIVAQFFTAARGGGRGAGSPRTQTAEHGYQKDMNAG